MRPPHLSSTGSVVHWLAENLVSPHPLMTLRSTCARGAGAGVLLIWRPWCEAEGIIVSSCFCSLPSSPLALPRTPAGSSQSSCFNLQLLSLQVPFLKNIQFPDALRGGAEGPAGGPGSLLSCGWYGRLNCIKLCGGINCIKFCGGINALMLQAGCPLKGVCF